MVELLLLLLLLLPLEGEELLLPLEEEGEELQLINQQKELKSILSLPLHTGQEWLHTIPIPSSPLKISEHTSWV